MSDWGEGEAPVDPPACSSGGCDREAAFFLFDRDADRWRPVCKPHARHAHPSIEVKAWMEAGYLKPVELGTPSGPPGEPVTGRMAAFRAEVDGTMGWSDRDDADER